MAAPVSRQRAAHELLYDINPQTGISIEVFYLDRTLETFGRWRRWLVLVAAPTRLFTGRSGDWSVCYQLQGVPARDDCAGRDLTVTHSAAFANPQR
jgi:hypothetical protein